MPRKTGGTILLRESARSCRVATAAAAVVDRTILDERVMGGHIKAVPGSVNASACGFGLTGPHCFAVRVA